MKVKTTFKYGIVIIESYDKTLWYIVYEYRKPTIKERQENITRKELTLELLYDLDNTYGLRDFDWEEFKMNPSLDKRMLKNNCV